MLICPIKSFSYECLSIPIRKGRWKQLCYGLKKKIYEIFLFINSFCKSRVIMFVFYICFFDVPCEVLRTGVIIVIET